MDFVAESEDGRVFDVEMSESKGRKHSKAYQILSGIDGCTIVEKR